MLNSKLEQIKSLIQVGECEFLDFKFEMYDIFHGNINAKILNRQEFFLILLF